MKRSRKGFTLVELLIVIAVLGALSAAMAISSKTATAKAKAASIANNLKICTSGAQIYNFEHEDENNVNTTTMLTAAVPNFTDFGAFDNDDKDTIIYAAVDTTTGPDGWTITVTLKGTDKGDIVSALKTIKGFKSITDPTADSTNNYVITYKVFNGTATGATAS